MFHNDHPVFFNLATAALAAMITLIAFGIADLLDRDLGAMKPHPNTVHLRRWKKRHPKRWYRMKVKWRAKYPEKHRAHSAVQYALKTGKLKRPDCCSKCGVKCKPQAHHPDYSKPLEVVWLCRKPCHREADAKRV